MIGRWLAAAPANPLRRAFAWLFGVPDFHTHLRLAPLQKYRLQSGTRLCELGCGDGIGVIELLLRNPGTTASGYEADAATIARATSFAEHCGLADRLIFHRGDLAHGVPAKVSAADCVLLLDVLEHLPDLSSTAAALAAQLKPGARLVVSLPTRLYPRLFGRRYHRLIGHLWDGFDLREVDALFTGLQRVRFQYAVGPLSWPGVLLCYRLPWYEQRTLLGRAYGALVNVISIPFRVLDVWNGSKVSCSLFVEYRKP
jgi:SAM-dependent methyltransferase